MSIASRLMGWLGATVGHPTPRLRWAAARPSQRYAEEIGPALDLPSRSKVIDGLIYPDWESVCDWVEENPDLQDFDADELWGDAPP